MIGVLTITAADEGGDFFDSLPGRVDRMGVDIVDDIVKHGARQVRERAPGSIVGLVEEDGASLADLGVISGVVGVTSGHGGEGLASKERGKTFVQSGSDPQDYPIFVHEGTGVFGEYGRPITVPVPGFMHIDFPDGLVRTRQVQGQRPQPYVEQAWEETAGTYVPARLASARLPSGGS